MKSTMILAIMLLLTFGCKRHTVSQKETTIAKTDTVSSKNATIKMTVLDSILSGAKASKMSFSYTTTEMTEEPVFAPNNDAPFLKLKGNWKIITDSMDSNKLTRVDMDDTQRTVTTEYDPKLKSMVATYKNGKKSISIPIQSDKTYTDKNGNIPTKKTTKTETFLFNQQDSTGYYAQIFKASKDSTTAVKDSGSHTNISDKGKSDTKSTVWSGYVWIVLVGLAIVVGAIFLYFKRKK